MKLSAKGYELIKKYEGFASRPYLDAVGVPTIGYGNTFYPDGRKVTLQDKSINEQDATFLLAVIVSEFEDGVDKLVTKPLKPHQFDALVSFAYNLGLGALKESRLLYKININTNDAYIPNEFTRWVKAGGRELRGLAKRRVEEANIYYNGYYGDN